MMLKEFSKSHPGAFKALGDYVTVGCRHVEELQFHAKNSPHERARLLLHSGQEDSLHEMVISLPFHSFDRPHINFKSGKSFLALNGIFAVVLFFDEGKKVHPIILSENGKIGNQLIRLNKPIWHTIVPLSASCVFLETIIGPFEGNQFAPFSPEIKNSKDFSDFAFKIKKQTYDLAFKKYNIEISKELLNRKIHDE